MSYRDEFRDTQREFYWSLPRVAFMGFAAIALIGGGLWVMGVFAQPGRIVSKTLDADNVIQKYEWFHDAHGNYLARASQVKQFKGLLAAESDKTEASRLRIDMAAMQQSCRELARRYNANAEKLNVGIFRGWSLPENLNAGVCE